MRLGHALFGHEKLYPQVFYAYWVVWPYKMWLMFIVLIVAWVHGCIGLYFWLRMKAFFKSAAPYLLAAAVLIPTLAMLGLYQGGRTVVAESGNAQWKADNLSRQEVGTAAEQGVLDQITDYFLIGYLGLIGLALIGRGVRALNERRHGMITLSYGNGRTVRVPKGLSVLEASLRNNVPHASVCGGRARCSTCRIRVIGDCDHLPEPSKREAFVLNRVGAGADPAIRLACQLRPETDSPSSRYFCRRSRRPLSDLEPGPHRRGTLSRQHVRRHARIYKARGKAAAVRYRLYRQPLPRCGLAGGDRMRRPAQPVRRRRTVGAVRARYPPQTACRQALKAAAMIAVNVDELNQFLKHDLREPIRFGIGIHGGEVIIGDIGYRDHMVFTALGDAVNVAARLQDMTKSLSCEVIVSEEVRKTAGLPQMRCRHMTSTSAAAPSRWWCARPSARSVCRRWLRNPRSQRHSAPSTTKHVKHRMKHCA